MSNRTMTILAGLSALTISACAGPTYYQAQVAGAFESPPTTSRAVGTVVATVYPSTRAMTYTINYQGLTGPASAAHFHGPAAPGANAGVLVPVTVAPNPITGGVILTPEQFDALQAGTVYFNMHTAAFPNGEMRGQLVRAQ